MHAKIHIHYGVIVSMKFLYVCYHGDDRPTLSAVSATLNSNLISRADNEWISTEM